MACDHPITALRLGVDEDTGKQRIKIKKLHIGESLADFRKHYGADRVLLLPCGQCHSCLLAKRKEWMIRCKCEAEYHKFNSFVTLTYDEQHYNKANGKEDFQLFIKKLRNLGHKVRYFACGEYGSSSNRFHMHAILFGYKPSDMKFSHLSDSNQGIFTSDELSNAWTNGLVVVQEFEPKVAGYVAGYTNKKVLDQRGFIMSSRRPGIGRKYCEDNIDEIYKYDLIQGDFTEGQKVIRPSRYFDKVADDVLMPFEMQVIRQERLEKADLVRQLEYFTHHWFKDEDMLYAQAYNASRKVAALKRGL